MAVLETGTVRTATTPEIKFQIEDLTIQFIFKMDASRGNGIIEPVGVQETKTLTINLTNHDNTLGSGIVDPLLIGSYQGKKLYVSFECRKVTDHMVWSLEYTFFLGEES